MARPGLAEVLDIRQLSGGKRTDLKRVALSRFVRTRLDIVSRAHNGIGSDNCPSRNRILLPIDALLGSEFLLL
jgi:hypothetical protein